MSKYKGLQKKMVYGMSEAEDCESDGQLATYCKGCTKEYCSLDLNDEIDGIPLCSLCFEKRKYENLKILFDIVCVMMEIGIDECHQSDCNRSFISCNKADKHFALKGTEIFYCKGFYMCRSCEVHYCNDHCTQEQKNRNVCPSCDDGRSSPIPGVLDWI